MTIPTPEQLQIAKQYKIPRDQAHLVNMGKVKAYQEYLLSPKGRDEMYLAELGVEHI